MSSELGKSSSCAISSSKELDWKMCIICQESTPKKGTIQKLNHIRSYSERANLQDGVYVDINGYLKEMSSETFIENKPVWHRSCYSDATNAISIQQARDCLEHAIFTGTYTAKNVDIKEHDLTWMKLT